MLLRRQRALQLSSIATAHDATNQTSLFSIRPTLYIKQQSSLWLTPQFQLWGPFTLVITSAASWLKLMGLYLLDTGA